MKKKIEVTKECKTFLMNTFGVSERTVRNALCFAQDNSLARRIQQLARERGGYIVTTGKEIETFHDADGVMRQYFPNGAVLELDKETGDGVVLFRGHRERTYENVLVSQIEGIQDWAGALK